MEKLNSVIKIDGQDYELVCNNKARKKIGDKFGGFEKFGEVLSGEGSYDDKLDKFGEAVLIMINQGIAVYNYHHKDEPKTEMTQDDFDLLTSPADYMDFSGAINAAVQKGMARNIQSEDDQKNAEVE